MSEQEKDNQASEQDQEPEAKTETITGLAAWSILANTYANLSF